METSNKYRQRKWKERQAADGKKAVSIMLSERTKRLIDQERKRTGETIASVIERAAGKLLETVTSNKDWNKFPPNRLTGRQKTIIKEVNRKHRGLHLPISEIAALQNKSAVPTLTGAEQWNESEVQLIIVYLQKHDLGVKLNLLDKWE